IGVLWQEQGDQPFMLDDLPRLQDKFNERALLEFIQDRLDKRLGSPYRELTRFGVLLRSFNLPMLQAVFPELFSGANAHDTFQQFIRYPYIESLGNQRRTIHELLREIQAIEIREQQPDEWRKYHKRALDYLTNVTPRPPDWYYHAIAFDEEQGMSDWWDAVVSAHNQGRREDCWALLQAVHDVTLALSAQASAQRAFHLGRYHSNWTDMSAAMDSYEAALGLFRQVGSRLGEANVRKAMGDVQQFRKENEAAMDSYEAALGLFRQVGSRLGEANCYLAQGRIALEEGKHQESLTLHNRAYYLYQQILDGYSQARLLYYRSNVYEAMNERQQALQDMEQCMAIVRPLNLIFIGIFQKRFDELHNV
ncbi:MAG: tetratricopeptide repeat protein, partial [Ktedonobacteraceae bacterium]